MKYLKSYNQILESIRDQMKPKDDKDIILSLSKLNVYDRIIKIKANGLDDKYLPSDDEIKEYLDDIEDMGDKRYTIYDKINTINRLELDDKFRPSDDEIKEYLDDIEDMGDKINTINNLKLDNKFFPSNDKVRAYLSEFDVEDWMNIVYEFDLDKSEFDPPKEKVLEYILPSNITYNNENNTLEFSEWSDFADLFKEDRDVRDGYIENVLSGMGHEYFEHYDIIEPDYFSFKNDKIFQDVKTQIKEKIDELDLSDEDEYDDMIKDFNSAESFSDLYDHVLKKYDMLDDIKTAVNHGYTNSQELADESEAYDSLTNSIINTFDGGEVSYENDKYIMPISIPDFDIDDIVDNGRIIEWEIPYYGWNGDVDDDTFREELVNKLYEI